MRYNTVGYLGTTGYTMDKYHNQVASTSWRKIYCNKYQDNVQLQQQAAVNDGRDVKQFEVMSTEYHGEKLFRLSTAEDAVVFTVTYASVKGDRTVLTVECKLG